MTSSNLIKLTIGAYSESTCTGSPLGTITAMINPDTYSRSYNVNYVESKEQGAPANTLIFSGIGRSDLDLKLVVDGTGIIPLPGASSVDEYITNFTNIVYTYQGTEHRPNYLKLSWGSLTFMGICMSLTVNYTLFTPDGKALRATISFKLSESKDYKTKSKEAQKSSPDLTHVRTVKAGDTLPLMTYRIYGDSSLYIEVARTNGLSSVSAIKPGDQIYFPPLKK